MAKHQSGEVGINTKVVIQAALDDALSRAEEVFNADKLPDFEVSLRFKKALDVVSNLSGKATTGFTNIVTCLAIKVAKPTADIRYHQTQIQNQTDRPAGFNFRGVSETIVAPWLSGLMFETAKSGWQTRTFERPKPYRMNYDENIGDIKDAFLACFDEIEEHAQSASNGLAHLMFLQLVRRENKSITLAIPKTTNIALILSFFSNHFSYKYKSSKGASRLPVLALYAIYKVMIGELERFKGKELRPLEEHSAADSQTGATGDIEIIDPKTASVFEALEIKHEIQISFGVIQSVQHKIMDKAIDRYYVLTTHQHCEPNEELTRQIAKIQTMYHCQIIVNGVLSTLKYYLRLLSDPGKVLPEYTALLKSEKTVSHEHREVWNKIATSV